MSVLSLHRLKRAAGMGLTALLALACLVGPAARAQSQPPQRTIYRRHFIVLIDDSFSLTGDSPSGRGFDLRPNIIRDLPGQLFGGIKGLGAFDPAQDRVSVVFFTIMRRDCGARKGFSALPENILDHVYTGRLQSRDDFKAKLEGWFNSQDGCRFNGNWSPIVVSSLLVLPYLQKKIPAGDLDRETILIQVTDGKFNSRTTPGHELTDYYRTGEIKDVPEADRQLNRVAGLFSVNVLPAQQPLNDVFYLAARYGSQRPPESSVQYQRNSLLYPQALSSSELRYRLNDQPLGDIQLLSQGKGAEFDFKPLWARVGFETEGGGEWRVGGVTLPRLTEQTLPVPLSPCQPPHCETSQDNERLGVGLFEAGTGAPLKFSPSAPDPEPGQIKFSVGFHYVTPVYDHMSVETPELLIRAAPARPAEIPNLFLPASRLGKSEVAAEWESDDDGVTTMEEAKNRVIAKRNLRWLLLLIALIVLAVLLMIFLFLRYYRRRFGPVLKWLAAPEVVVDFNRPAASRLLVGTLKVENDQPVPWFGRIFRNEEQPTREAEISLEYNYFQQSGLDVAGDRPIGFVRGDAADASAKAASGAQLDGKTLEAVSDGKQVYVFLAAENILDYEPGGGAGAPAGDDGHDARFDIPVKAWLRWDTLNRSAAGSGSAFARTLRGLKAWLAAERAGADQQEIGCSLTVKPEDPRKPRVTYEPSAEPKLYFDKGQPVRVGTFWFESRALHRFARPYQWTGYTIQTYEGNRPLSGESIRLADPEVEVPPGELVEVPVYIHCDGQTIPNPAPASREYTFRLLGDFDSAESDPGPHLMTLYRDPARADIELRLLQPKREVEVYWTPAGDARLRTLPDGADADELMKEPGLVVLEPQTIRFDPNTSGVRALLEFEIGNTGTSGDGTVAVEMNTIVRCDPAVRNTIQMQDGQTLDDVLGVYDVKVSRPDVSVKEGDPPQRRSLYLRPGVISRIPSARLKSDEFAAEVRLAIRVVNDRKEETRRTLRVVIPIYLEQLPTQDWLAIDFGTSAISVALGTGRNDDAVLIPLQTITVKGGRSFAQHDTENAERNDKFLLPSWICCNWDLRDPSGDTERPGFPGYYSPHLSKTPGEPDYIGLPAVTHEFEEHPGRIIYSLKSWLGKSSPNIPIEVKRGNDQNGKATYERKLLPLEKMVESGFAALAEAYLLPEDYRAEQIAITYPNTFTRRHQDLLHRIAYNALGKPGRFGIPLRERVSLVSESDAAAYHYCSTRADESPRAGTERLLVYDFGAGTLDLSLIRVEWKPDPPHYPLEWKVEKRLGVPVAGNYIDEMLARLIHKLLEKSDIVEWQGFKYELPIVGLKMSADSEQRTQHRRAIIRLWQSIREGKHKWSDACRAILDNGGSLSDCPPLRVRVGARGERGIVIDTTGIAQREVVEPVGAAGLYIETRGDIYLSIPSYMIQDDERVSEFLRFVTGDVIDETLAGAGVAPHEVDTILVSGRGARFPGMREQVWGRFPHAETPDLINNDTMKSAVVLGAIARQDLSRKFDDASDDTKLAPRLALLTRNNELVPESEWDRPEGIDLTASPTFRLVQINLRDPDPRSDMKTLRKHFYIDLADREFVRDDLLGDDKHLRIRKEIKDGELAIYLWGVDGGTPAPVFPEDQVATTVTNPPWPVGPQVLLHPKE